MVDETTIGASVTAAFVGDVHGRGSRRSKGGVSAGWKGASMPRAVASLAVVGVGRIGKQRLLRREEIWLRVGDQDASHV